MGLLINRPRERPTCRIRWRNSSYSDDDGSMVVSLPLVTQLPISISFGESDHSFMRKMVLLIEFIYQTINMLFAWLAIVCSLVSVFYYPLIRIIMRLGQSLLTYLQGNFFLVFHILTASLSAQELLGRAGAVLGVIFEWLCLATLVACFVLSLGNRPQGSNKFYMTMVYFWVGIMVYLAFAAIFVTVKSIQLQVAENSFSFGQLFSNQEFFTIFLWDRIRNVVCGFAYFFRSVAHVHLCKYTRHIHEVGIFQLLSTSWVAK